MSFISMRSNNIKMDGGRVAPRFYVTEHRKTDARRAAKTRWGIIKMGYATTQRKVWRDVYILNTIRPNILTALFH